MLHSKYIALSLHFSKLCYIPNISLNNPRNNLCWLLAVSFMRTFRKNCPITEFFLVRIFLYSTQIYSLNFRIQLNTDHKKLRNWTPFTLLFSVLVKNAQCTFTPLKPIAVTKLREYVAQNRQNKDRGFIDEFRVCRWNISIDRL